MKRMLTLAIAGFLVILATPEVHAQFAPAPLSTQTTVISGGTLIDGTGKQPLADSVIIIHGNTIQEVGRRGSISVPTGAETIDATGKFVLPGYIDSHVHYNDWVAELLLAYGITSIIDNGSPTEWILAIRDGIAKGKMIGPRIFASGDQLGIKPDVAARNPEEARRSVRNLIAKGVNKIAATTLQTPETLQAIVEEAEKANIPISGYSMYPREAIAAGVGALEHCYSIAIASKKNPKQLEEIRLEQTRGLHRYEKQPLHYLVEPNLDDFVDLLVKKRAYLLPDLEFDYKVINDHAKEFEKESFELLTNPGLRYLPIEDYIPQILEYSESALPRPGAVGMFGTLDRGSAEFRQYQQSYRNLQGFIRKLVQAGGKVLAGPDSPNMLLPGLSFHHELRLLSDAGLTPMQVILAATQWPATFLRQQDKIGTLEQGKLADLVIVRANPLDDITNLRKIDLVIKDGVVQDRTFHPDYSPVFPRPEPNSSQMNQPPVVTDLSPKSATEGDNEVELTVRGREFVKEATVILDGERVSTTWLQHTEVHATIPGRLLTRPGMHSVAVWNPRPLGGMSNDLKLVVRYK